MRMRSALVLALVLAACSSQKARSDSLQETCNTLAVTIEASRQARESATNQYRSAQLASQKWDKWERKLVTPDDDRMGDYSHAAVRIWMYKGAGDALCQSSLLMDDLLREVPASQRRLVEDLGSINGNICEPMPLGGAELDRFFSAWLAAKQQMYDVENIILDKCRQQVPGWEPPRASLRRMVFGGERQEPHGNGSEDRRDSP